MMATSFDDLVEILLYDVALSGSKGIGSEELARAVRAFYELQKPRENPAPAIKVDLLFSEAPLTTSIAVDDNLMNAVWEWLDKHPDVQIRTVEDVAEASGRAEKRIFTTEERVWHVITGHGVDHQRVPPREFACLSVVAAHGPEGVLQPDVTKVTKQDKRSVPHRTDMLVAKGYIVKDAVIGKGTKTSLLRLRKFASQQNAKTGPVHARAYPETDVKNSRVVHYSHWYDSTMRQLKDNGNIIAIDDLRVGLDIYSKQWEVKALARCLKRLAAVGCIRKLKARVQNEHVDTAEAKYMRCLQLLREPTEDDRVAFIRNEDVKKPKKGKGRVTSSSVQNEAVDGGIGEGGESEDEDEEEEDLLAPLRNRVPPQWTPEVPNTNFIYNSIDAAGPEGISSMDLNARSMGPTWRRPLDEIMVKLTDIWQRSQPSHLKHLAIVKDAAVQGRIGYFQYRTYPHFEKAVELGLTEWAAVLKPTKARKKKSIVSPITEMDEWGLPRLHPHKFADADGRATLLECQGLARHDARILAGQAGIMASSDVSTAFDPDVVPRPERRTPKRKVKTPRWVLDEIETPNPKKKGRVTSEDETKLYKENARVVAERLVRVEINNTRRKRMAEDAELDEAAEDASNKLPRMDKSPSPAIDLGPVESEEAMLVRVREVEADILARLIPGMYINPPGLKDMKSEFYSRVGRPGKSMIALFKSDKLKDLSWFGQAGPRATFLTDMSIARDNPIRIELEEEAQDMGDDGRIEVIADAASNAYNSSLPAAPLEPSKRMLGQRERRRRELLASSAASTLAGTPTRGVKSTLPQIEPPVMGSSVSSTSSLESTPHPIAPPDTSTLTTQRSGPASGTRRRSSATQKTQNSTPPTSTSLILNAVLSTPTPRSIISFSRPTPAKQIQTPGTAALFPKRRGRPTKAMVAERERIRLEQEAGQDVVGVTQTGSLTGGDGEGRERMVVKLPLLNASQGHESLVPAPESFSDSATRVQDGKSSLLVKLRLPAALRDQQLLQQTPTEESDHPSNRTQDRRPSLVIKFVVPQAVSNATHGADVPAVAVANAIRSNLVANVRSRDPQIIGTANSFDTRDDSPLSTWTPMNGLTIVRPYFGLTNKDREDRTAVQSSSDQDQPVDATVDSAPTILAAAVDIVTPDRAKEDQQGKGPGESSVLPTDDFIINNGDETNRIGDFSCNRDSDVLPELKLDVSEYTFDHVDRAYKTARTHRQGGTTRLRRANIVLDVIKKMGGTYGGDSEIWYAFMAAWQKHPGYQNQTPDRRTVEKVVNGLVAQRMLKRYMFTFQISNGKTETRHILTLPDVDPGSSSVKQFQKGIIDHHPRLYLSRETDISEDIRQRAARLPAWQHKRKHDDDEFPQDDDVTYIPPKKKAAPPLKARDGFPFDQEVIVKRTPAALRVSNIESQRSYLMNTKVLQRTFVRPEQGDKDIQARGNDDNEDSSDEDDDELLVSEDQAANSFDFQLDSYKFDPNAVPKRQPKINQPRRSLEVGREIQRPKTPLPRKRLGGLRTPLIKRRPTAKPARMAMSGTKAGGAETHISLLMCPGQAFHKASGTFDTTGVVSGRLQEASEELETIVLRNRSVNIQPDVRRLDPAPFLGLGQHPANQYVNSAQSWDEYMSSYLSMPSSSEKLLLVNTGPNHPHFSAQITPTVPRSKQKKGKGLATESEPNQSSLLQKSASVITVKKKRPYESQKNKKAGGVESLEGLEAARIDNSLRFANGDFPSASKRPCKSTNSSADVAPSFKVPTVNRILLENKAASSKTTTSANEPNSSRNRAQFPDCKRLSIAVALFRTVCGGADDSQDLQWDIIAHALGFKYDIDSLKRQWVSQSKDSGSLAFVKLLQEAIHEPFLESYENGDLPDINFDNINQTDWPALTRWVELEVLPLGGVQDLRESRMALHDDFEVELIPDQNQHDRSRFFENVNDTFRSHFAAKLPFTVPEASTAISRDMRQHANLDHNSNLAKSWIRAVAMTKEENYNESQAGQKLCIFDGRALHQMMKEMEETSTIQAAKPGRQFPGRNFHIHNHALSQFKRWPGKTDEYKFLKRVAAARVELVQHFEAHDQLEMKSEVTEAEMLVLTNMVAQGHLKVTTILPERNDDFDAPFPKLSAWGYGGRKHEKWIDKSYFALTLVYKKTSAFTSKHDLETGVRIPMYPPAVLGEAGFRIPFWVDIHGNFLGDVWDMVLRSVLHLVVYRPGSTAKAIEEAHKTKLWAWEIELLLGWMEKVGIAQRFGAGREEDGVWKGGWRAGTWWYCSFLPDVASWKAPAGAVGEVS